MQGIIHIRLIDERAGRILHRPVGDSPFAGKSARYFMEIPMIVITSLARLASLLSAPVRGLAMVTRKLRHRSEVRALTFLSDHQLKDVGLTRSEVAGALAVGWLDDPSCMLAARNDERSGLVALHRRSELRSHPVRQVAVSPADAARLAGACCAP
jgi:uncharacterized protein YjiS (DUF1127 family)